MLATGSFANEQELTIERITLTSPASPRVTKERRGWSGVCACWN